MKTKKSQIGLGESVAVVIVFIILISFGFIWYVQYQTSNIKDQGQRAYELKATQIITNIESLPEIQCSMDGCQKCGGTETSYVYDYYKIKDSYNTIADHLPYYISILGSAEISFEVLDPRFNTYRDDLNKPRPKHLVVYNLTIDKYRGTGFQIPVTIYDPIDDMCYMGAINITLFE